MPEKLPIDSNAGASSQVGVGRVNQTNRALHQINPNWVEDGYGVVGPQRQVVKPANARPFPMDFGIDSSPPIASGEGTTLIVTAEDASGYAPGAGVTHVNGVTTLTFDRDNFEIYDGGGGQCVVKLKTCPATCEG